MYLDDMVNITLLCIIFHCAEVRVSIFPQCKMTEMNYKTIKCQVTSLQSESQMNLLKLPCYMSLMCINAG